MIYTVIETKKHRIDVDSRKEALSFAPEMAAMAAGSTKHQSFRVAIFPPLWAIKQVIRDWFQK
jgi:hypothetical protein